MPTQIEKLQAHAAHLLDAFIQLRERYALLEPMLFDEAVTKERGSGQQARGFRILKHSLFLSCSQYIAKLSLDDDQRTPSLSNLVRSLSDEAICAELKKTFTAWEVPLAEEAKEPEIVEALRRMALREEAERQEQFDSLHGEAMELWSKLSTSDVIKGFQTIRDKVSAHTEVHFVADKYQFVDIVTLGIKWGDLRSTINEMQRLVELMGMLIRNSGFAWEMLDGQLSKAGQEFWGAASD